MYWKAKGIVAAIFSLGIMIPVQATLLPLFQGLDRLGIRGGYLGLMLPYITFAMPMTVMILSGFFKALPREIEEAACIDGCNIFNMFFRIILPCLLYTSYKFPSSSKLLVEPSLILLLISSVT